jgi:hypothetical protein
VYYNTYYGREKVTAFPVRLRAKEADSFSHDTTTLLRGRSNEKDGRDKIEVPLLLLRNLGMNFFSFEM